MTKAPLSAPSVPLLRDDELADGGIRGDRHGMDAAETARYVSELTAELSYLARQARLDLLAYLLDMARLEAARAVQADTRKR